MNLHDLIRLGTSYKREQLNALTFPIGGIGTGSISLNGYGELVEWQIFNNVDSRAYVPYAFFAIWIKGNKGVTVKVLQRSRPILKKDIWWMTNTTFMLPRVDDIEFIGMYPIGLMKYKDRDLPVDVVLEVFSPFIPPDAKNSAIPVAIFIFHIWNKTGDTIRISLMASLQNAIGYDGHSTISGNRFQGFGGNVNKLITTEHYKAVFMYSEGIKEDDPKFGTICLATMNTEATCLIGWNDIVELWNDFSSDGTFEDRGEETTPSSKGTTWNTALSVGPIDIEPGGYKEVVFLIAWHFPNRVIDWDPKRAGIRVGNMYNNWFKNALEVVDYVVSKFDYLREKTELFAYTLYDSTLPREIVDSVSTQLSTMRTPTLMWLEDGTIACFEGCSISSGCCPMNCTHVYNYEQSIAFTFPSIERRMRELDLGIQMENNGMIHHRTVIPLDHPRESGPAIDGQLGTILKTYREFLFTGDIEFLRKYWPRLILAMDYVLREYDRDGDGVIEWAQPNTYDCIVYGPNTFIGTLYLAALKAMMKMAEIVGDREAKAKYEELFKRGMRKLDKLTWNGEYYVQRLDVGSIEEARKWVKKDKWLRGWAECSIGSGCLSDQLLGQWWAHILDLGYLLPQEHIIKALKSIYKYNWRRELRRHVHSQRVYAFPNEGGLINCTWPKGDRPSDAIWYCDEVWTGVEYEVATLMIYESMIREALEILKAIRERYDGRTGSPWDEVECGEHYARPMSSWSLLLAAMGYKFDAYHSVIKFSPRINEENFKALFTTATGWGSYRRIVHNDVQREMIYTLSGEITVKTILLKRSIKTIKEITMNLNGKEIEFEYEILSDKIKIETKDSRLKLKEGDLLEIIIR